MLEHRYKIPGRGPGITHEVLTLSFGDPTARPHVHVQGGLHADEGPGMMVARLLADLLQKAEAEGTLLGHVTVVPYANPLALGQVLHGDLSGRFDLYDGRNFNRDYPDLTEDAGRAVQGRLSDDPQANVATIRTALADALSQRQCVGPADTLRHHLMGMALGADLVLDLHCDGEAEMHLYTHPDAAGEFAPLAALTGCRAVLLAEVSGGQPFDEALISPWTSLAARFPNHPIPLGCASCTVELRGRADVCRVLGLQDAQAIMDFMIHLDVVKGAVVLPQLSCAFTPLQGSEALTAPVAGLLSYVANLGTHIERGETVAQITDLVTGAVTPITATTSGVFYARPATRIAEAGKRLGKIAGTVPFRDGPLLSP